MTTQPRFTDPQPVGIHAIIINHLDQARTLMQQVEIAEARPRAIQPTLADMFDRQVAQMIATLDADWKRRWWAVATAQPTLIFAEIGQTASADVKAVALRRALATETMVKRDG